MKIALFSDLHGNDEAFEAILADIEKQGVDLVACAGDVVDPFSGSAYIWQKLRAMNIPIVMGNHEEYILAMVDPADPLNIQTKINFWPLHYTFRLLSDEMVADMRSLPLSLTLPGPNGDDVFLCHASPHHTRRSISHHFDAEMAESLSQISARVIVAGHIHEQWRKAWQGKSLFLCGGAGLHRNGIPRAQYLILTHQRGQWVAEHRSVAYDHAAMLRKTRESRFFDEGGPVAWVFYDKLRTAELRMVPFLKSLKAGENLVTLDDWTQAVERFLIAVGSWDEISAIAR